MLRQGYGVALHIGRWFTILVTIVTSDENVVEQTSWYTLNMIKLG